MPRRHASCLPPSKHGTYSTLSYVSQCFTPRGETRVRLGSSLFGRELQCLVGARGTRWIHRLRRYVHTYGVNYIHGTNDKEGCWLLSTYLLTYILYIHPTSHHCTTPTFPFPFLPPRLASAHTAHSLVHTAANTTLQSASCAQPILLRRQRQRTTRGDQSQQGKTESLRGRLLGAVRREVMGWEQDVSQSVVRER